MDDPHALVGPSPFLLLPPVVILVGGAGCDGAPRPAVAPSKQATAKQHGEDSEGPILRAAEAALRGAVFAESLLSRRVPAEGAQPTAPPAPAAPA